MNWRLDPEIKVHQTSMGLNLLPTRITSNIVLQKAQLSHLQQIFSKKLLIQILCQSNICRSLESWILLM